MTGSLGRVCRCQEPPLREPRLSPLKGWLRRGQSSSWQPCPAKQLGQEFANPWGGGWPPPNRPPLGYPRAFGYDVVPPLVLRKQESILWDAGEAREPPSGYPRSAGTTWGVIPAKAGIHPWDGRGRPPPPLWVPAARARRGSTVIPAEACPRGNGEQESIPHNRPNSPCKSPKIGLQIVDKAKAFAIPFRAVIP